jgi:hypothetical protein
MDADLRSSSRRRGLLARAMAAGAEIVSRVTFWGGEDEIELKLSEKMFREFTRGSSAG